MVTQFCVKYAAAAAAAGGVRLHINATACVSSLSRLVTKLDYQ